MARITFNNIKTSLNIQESYDIVNAIRNSSGDTFKQYVPLANADNVADIGAGIMATQSVQNDFISALVDRIGLVVIRQAQLTNHLKKFKKGTMPFGRKIEEIFTDITKAKQYDPELAETTLYKREIPNVKTLFHERNRQDFYVQTIQDESLKTAFTSWGNFEGFVSSIINAIYNSAEVDEYKYMKLLVDNYYSKGLFTVVPVTHPDSETTARELVKRIRAIARKMTLPVGSREYNALAVQTRSEMENLHLLIDADLEAELDVEVLAKAFNMDKTQFMGHVTVIDGFASQGLEAVLIDEEWFMVYDNNLKMETVRNARGLYWNYYYHVWQTLSVSRFANAVAFVSDGVKPVTQVIVDPTIASIKQGRQMEFNGVIRINDGKDYDIDWNVEGLQGATLTGTSIDSDGVLTVGENQIGELRVTATVTYLKPEDGTTEVDVVGESLVSVQPDM